MVTNRRGWYNESRRHALARAGVKTAVQGKPINKIPERKQSTFTIPIEKIRTKSTSMIADNNMINDARKKGYEVTINNKEGYAVINGEYYNLTDYPKKITITDGSQKKNLEKEGWEFLPFRSYSVNPNQLSVEGFKKGDLRIWKRTDVEANKGEGIIEVWKERIGGDKRHRIYPTKTFKNDYYGNKEAQALIKKLRNNEGVYYD